LNNLSEFQPVKQLPFIFGLIGFCLGLVVTFAFLSGDAQGRVNLLYLLLLFVFLPVAGFLVTMLALLFRSGSGLAQKFLEIPIWPQPWQRQVLLLRHSNVKSAWLFYLSQLLVLSLGAGCLLAFFFMLLLNDVSFVWRSTVLEAADLLPLLNLLAIPWSFWSEAQPSLALLQLSQDFRLASQNNNAQFLGQWWKYALAAQLTYNILPRAVMLTISRLVYNAKRSASLADKVAPPGLRSIHNHMPEEGALAPIIHELARPYVLINWASAGTVPLDYLTKNFGSPVQVENMSLEGAGSINSALLSTYSEAILVVLVKSWEPPMGELKDYLESIAGSGVICPLDWDSECVNNIRMLHLDEWRRFCGTLKNWSVLAPVEVL
jgi:hypothetical protein